MRRLVTRPSRAFFLLARPIQNTDNLPSSIGESDVFFSEEAALDALDLHYGWCAARSGGFTPVVTTAQWYLQTAMIGPRITPSLGEVYLASSDAQSGETWASAGGFLTEGELIHWSSFVRAVRPWIPREHRDRCLRARLPRRHRCALPPIMVRPPHAIGAGLSEADCRRRGQSELAPPGC